MSAIGRCSHFLRGIAFLTALLLFGSVATPGVAGDASPEFERAPRVRLKDGQAAALVRRALASASRRLEEPSCHSLLEDFRDASGRTLRAALEQRTLTAAEHLNGLLFYEGAGQPGCGPGIVLAITAVGSSVVFVCSKALVKNSRRGQAGHVMVIHEMLHSLGLQENPPTPSEINARVIARCGG